MIERVKSGLDFKTALFVSCKHFKKKLTRNINKKIYFRFSIFLYHNIWGIFGVFIIKNRPFYFDFCCTFFLQPHGSARHTRINANQRTTTQYYYSVVFCGFVVVGDFIEPTYGTCMVL